MWYVTWFMLGFVLAPAASASAQSPLTDQILVTVLRDRVFAATPTEGLMRVDLLAGEEVRLSGSCRSLEDGGPWRAGRDPRYLGGRESCGVVTDRRALAFSAFTGGFFQQDLSSDEPVLSGAVNDNVVILSTGARRWIFRSQLAIWAELR